MGKLGFYLDATNCIGCGVCQVACKDTHRLRVGLNMRKISTWCTGSYPDVHLYSYTLSCNHCGNPSCVEKSNGLLEKDPETGLVLQTSAAACADPAIVESCPYGAIEYDEQTGTLVKCDSCIELREAGELPACVASCPQRALEFGDIDELKAKHAGERLAVDFATMPESGDLAPSLLVRVKDCMFDEDFERVVL